MFSGLWEHWLSKGWRAICKFFVRRQRGPSKEELDRQGERIAEEFLKKAGYKILARRVQLGQVEVDLLAMEEDVLVAVEVKTRTHRSRMVAFWQITPEKRRRLRRALQAAAKKMGSRLSGLRCDVVLVIVPSSARPKIFHYKNVPLES
jgi:putative endonuclease